MQHNTPMQGNLNRRWVIQSDVSKFIFERFAECMADIGEHVRVINEMCVQGQLNAYSFNRGARDISVAIRKVMLDGNGYLFKECVEPLLHPLKDPKSRPRKGLRGDVLVERLGGMALHYTEGESQEQKAFRVPGYEHRTVVNPLYGLRRTGKEQYQLEDPFDLSRQPMKYSHWMKTKVLQVGEDVLTSERILQLLANYEGAHAETNEMTRLNASLPVDVTLPKRPKREDELYRRGIWVTFGGVSYLHIFTLLVGVYLVNMTKETLKQIPEDTMKRFHITHLLNSILRSPLRIKSPTLRLEKAFNTGVVLQSNNDVDRPFELVGDYDKPGS